MEQTTTAYLVLENGMVFEGEYFGAVGEVTGEIVFTTGMTGYLETLTDPSYYGQIILQTFPLIGNYGVIPADFESKGIAATAYIVKYPCDAPSNFRCEGTLDHFLKQQNVVGLCGIDTRALTKIIREYGVMNGTITSIKPSSDVLDPSACNNISSYRVTEAVSHVSCKEASTMNAVTPHHTVALLDFGAKENIQRELLARGCNVHVLPHDSTTEEILARNPDGVMLSNGPGDPADNPAILSVLQDLMQEQIPMFGICLGHQLLALANGFQTEKLKYGHRGANQPVKDVLHNRVYITSQNHGYTVVSQSIDPAIATESFLNLNDGTCEGISYRTAPVFSVQFHPEAAAGPLDTAFLFDQFLQTMQTSKSRP